MRVLFLVLILFGFLNGQEIGKPFVQVGHTFHITSVAITPDGNYVLSASSDKTLKLWNLKTGKEIRTFRGHKFSVTSVAITPDGNYVLSASSDKTLKLWNLKTGKEIRTFIGHKQAVETVAITPDGKNVLSGSLDQTLKLWNLKTGKEIRTFTGHKKTVVTVTITPDGNYALSASSDKTLKLWNLKTGKEIRTFRGHSSDIILVAITPDGKNVLSGSGGGILKLWNLKTGKEIQTFKEYTPETLVTSVAITPDGKNVLSGSGGGILKLWNLKTGKVIWTFKGHDATITSLAITPDGNYAFSGDFFYGTLKLWNLKTGKIIRISRGDSGSLLTTSDGKYRGNGTLKLLTMITDKGYLNSVENISTTLDENYVLVGTDDLLKLWSLKTGKDIQTFNVNKSLVTSVAITPDGKYALSGNYNGTLKFWNLKTGEEIRTFRGHKFSVTSVAVTPDGNYALSSSSDKTLKLWNLKTGEEIRTFIGHDATITSLAITADGKYVLSGSLDQTLKLWNLKTGKKIRTFIGHKFSVVSVVITPDGKNVLSGSHDGMLKLWNLKTGKEIRTFQGNDFVHNLFITSDGKFALSGNGGTIVKIWDIKSGKLLLTSYVFEKDEWIAITPEGYYNASKNGAEYLNVLTAPMTVTSVDTYAEKFYRPDIVKLAMQGKKVDTGVKMSDIKPAPEVNMSGIPQQTDKKQVEVTLSIKDMGGGIGDVRIYRNGTAIALKSRDMQRSQKDMHYMTLVVPLEKGKNALKAIAFESTNSLRSEPAVKTVFTSYVEKTKPSLHAVIIGIEKFRNSRLNLQYTKSDAIVLKDTLEQYTKRLFKGVNVTLLTTKDETSKEHITKVLESLQKLNPHDMFLLFIASHGTVDMGDYYLITSNVGSTRTEKLKKDALSQAEITKLISNIPTSKKLIVLDTCHAGALGTGLNRALLNRGMSEDTAIKILSRATGTTILSASLSTQQALEGYRGHGLFSHVLLDGLKGKADFNGDGFVKTTELYDYINDTVPELSQKVFGVEQFPTANLNGQSFPITKVGK